MNKLLNKKVTSINTIYVFEDGEEYKQFDSVFLQGNKGDISFQIQTNQKGVFIYEIDQIENVNIDGEYEIESVFVKKNVDIKDFIIINIEVFWDEEKEYILGFKLISNVQNLCFIRLIDEIIEKPEIDFYSEMNSVDYIIEVLK